MLRILLPFLFVTAVLGTYGGGGGSYAEYDCGGSCGGGCSQQSGSYSSPCGGGQAAPVVHYESSGCDGDCGGGGSSSRYSSGRASSSGYHKTVTTVTKETRNDHLKIVVGKPVVHRTTYVQPAPQPQVVYKKARYVDEGSNYGGGSSYSGGGDYDCGGQCGGGSKIVKIIKKTTYSGGDGGVCTTCDYSGGGGESSYSSNIEYSQPIVRKVTRIVTQPKIVRVIKTSVVQPVETSGEYYEDSGSSGCGGGGCGGQSGGYTSKRYTSGGSGGYGGGGGRSKAFAFASASASAGAGAGSSSGDYVGGGGGGCKSGCQEEWKK